jgi:hypothetical protein
VIESAPQACRRAPHRRLRRTRVVAMAVCLLGALLQVFVAAVLPSLCTSLHWTMLVRRLAELEAAANNFSFQRRPWLFQRALE